MKESQLFSLTFADLSGNAHRMIIRKAPVKSYDQKRRVDDCMVIENRYFYEVVYQENILALLRK